MDFVVLAWPCDLKCRKYFYQLIIPIEKLCVCLVFILSKQNLVLIDRLLCDELQHNSVKPTRQQTVEWISPKSIASLFFTSIAFSFFIFLFFYFWMMKSCLIHSSSFIKRVFGETFAFPLTNNCHRKHDRRSLVHR